MRAKVPVVMTYAAIWAPADPVPTTLTQIMIAGGSGLSRSHNVSKFTMSDAAIWEYRFFKDMYISLTNKAPAYAPVPGARFAGPLKTP